MKRFFLLSTFFNGKRQSWVILSSHLYLPNFARSRERNWREKGECDPVTPKGEKVKSHWILVSAQSSGNKLSHTHSLSLYLSLYLSLLWVAVEILVEDDRITPPCNSTIIFDIPIMPLSLSKCDRKSVGSIFCSVLGRKEQNYK